MPTKKLALCLMIALLMLSTPLSPALGAATLTENGQIQAPKSDIREVIADNAALVAEVEAVRESLTSERKSTAELIAELNRYTAASEEEKRLLREQNGILRTMNATLEKQIAAEKRKGIGKMIIGLLVGAGIGALAAH